MTFHRVKLLLPLRVKCLSQAILPRRFYCDRGPFSELGLTYPQRIKMDKRYRKDLKFKFASEVRSKQKKNEAPRQTSVVVISPGSKGVGCSIALNTGGRRYLFNCAEGDQRYFTNLCSNVDHIFFTQTSWTCLGGLLGFVWTKFEDPLIKRHLSIHGPPYLMKPVEGSRMFTEDKFNLTPIRHFGIEHEKFEDDHLTVEYVELLKAAKEESKKAESEAKSEEGKDLVKTVRELRDEIRRIKPVMSYIVRLRPLKPKVDYQKLLQLGEEGGPWVGELVNGQSVTLKNGKTVNPEDVLSNVVREGPIVVLDCPSEDYLDALITNKQLLDLNSETTIQKPVIIIHMTPASVVESDGYKAFMDRFDSETQHLMLNENSPGPCVHKSQEFHTVLNDLHPEIFPSLHGSIKFNESLNLQKGNITQGQTCLTFNVRPLNRRGFDFKGMPYVDKVSSMKHMYYKAEKAAGDLEKIAMNEEVLKECARATKVDIRSRVNAVKNQLSFLKKTSDLCDEYPEIVFLGTGAAKPSTIRSASAILVQMRKDEYLLLDCGEHTLTQLYQMYDLEKTKHILRNLKGIFISHLHFDHHGGLITLLEARDRVLNEIGSNERIKLFAPASYKKWFHVYVEYIADKEPNIDFISSHLVYEEVKYQHKKCNYLEVARSALDVTEFVIIPVVHTNSSYGISFKHKDGWKLVYSGDTMPCGELIRVGKDCDYLIHEATFTDEWEATQKRHCTATQAINIGRQMNAKFILLTHFSQRFPKCPEFKDDFTENVGFSYDFMQLRPSQLQQVPMLKPALQAMFGIELALKNMSREENLEESQNKFIQKNEGFKKAAEEKCKSLLQQEKAQWSKAGQDLKSKLELKPEQTDSNDSENESVGNILVSTLVNSRKRKLVQDEEEENKKSTDYIADLIESTSTESASS